MSPFFTTRPVGEGLGLGLTTAQSIIEQLGGQLAVQGRLRRPGTTVTIHLKNATPAGAALKVLIIDDNARVGRALGRLLRQHRVELLESGEDALNRLGNDTMFDVVICDLMMPGMSGLDLYARLETLRPELTPRFLFTTGGAWSERSRAFLKKHDGRVIHKPFQREQIESAIAEVVARNG